MLYSFHHCPTALTFIPTQIPQISVYINWKNYPVLLERSTLLLSHTEPHHLGLLGLESSYRSRSKEGWGCWCPQPHWDLAIHFLSSSQDSTRVDNFNTA